MATRSSIAAKFSDGTFKCVYCHFDGYLSGNGKTLLEHYNTSEKIEALIALGSMSSLGKRCDQPEGHSFDTPNDDCTVYYSRDRGEKWEDCKPQEGATFEEATKGMGQEYNYFWDGEKWLVACYGTKGLTPLAEAIANKADQDDE
ncbi:hypothetical protein D3C76_639630 [compost metagenome]